MQSGYPHPISSDLKISCKAILEHMHFMTLNGLETPYKLILGKSMNE